MTIKSMLIALLSVQPVVALAAPVQIIADNAMFSPGALKIDYRFQGMLGDVVDLTDGSHRVDLIAQNGYTFKFSLRVNGGLVSVLDQSSEPPNCKPGLAVQLNPPTVSSPDAAHAFFAIHFQTPKFGKPTGSTACTSAEMASCNSQKIILNANSDPAGAEIWVDGKKADQTTNVTLSVPYCSYERSKYILFRQPGMVNCGKEIKTAPNAELVMTCKMTKLH